MQTLAYGSWPSPIAAGLAAAHDGQPEFVGFVGDEAWWTEPRPTEGGRRTLVRRRADGVEESVLSAPWNVRSRVIEYGGRPWAGAARPEGPLVVFVDFADQRLYAHEPDTPGARPRPLTPVSPVGGGLRWVDPRLRVERGEVWCVLEEFTGDGPTDVRRVVAAVPLDGSAAEDRGAVRELTDGRHRFVTGPRLSPDGRRAAWLAWDHPRMPWDGTELIVAEVAGDGTLREAHTVAGGPDESIAQVDWAHDGSLLYASDRTGWWNLYRDDEPVCPREEEFGGPLWKIGQRWFAPLESGLIAVVHGRGATALGILDPETGEVVDAAGPWTEFAATLAVHGTRVVGIGASPRSAYEVVELDTLPKLSAPIEQGQPRRPRPGDRRRARRPGRPRVLPRAADPHVHRAGGARDPRAHLPSAQPRVRRARRRAAALRHLGARRPHQPGAPRPRPGDRLLHLARHRGRRGQLRRIDRARAGVPQPAA